ncbi:hypothetical protein A176_004291 [Myxococcus hansupus]|uniref:Uncharacterized protein n=1 Tax=Pseudomyxococcus hansupus TaxID=1297742 RepID=A0A0H4WX42_9BACT|nr:hypothetical protein A176_004291 [Myxococcus hansupus]
MELKRVRRSGVGLLDPVDAPLHLVGEAYALFMGDAGVPCFIPSAGGG